ncbi:MAG: [FeFe] hydrogenase H-cluster maturation GTPase HydF [Treponema sp.]|jgi:[FeFe] hydrogenase H-cluster maturation GTPase HydF|nr:[FeFe] hydrogenase H-cluster maturation GTPase HydF [Treponema sp.]
MEMNKVPAANRVFIAFFGRRNAGKSSLVNAVTGQHLALVSDVKGTTTDPVYKAMELPPLGPVVIIDTPGFDDEGELGAMRVNRVKQVLRKTDLAVLVLDGGLPFEPQCSDTMFDTAMSDADVELINKFITNKIPYIIVLNKSDLCNTDSIGMAKTSEILPVSAKDGYNINLLKDKIASLAINEESNKKLIAGLIRPGDFVVLVTPIDKAAPKGRLILPQQQVLRDILDTGSIAIAVKESELSHLMENIGKKPALVITDSQVFAQVSLIVPPQIPLTSFSILFARYKGFLETAVKGAITLDNLNDGDNILVCEGCTHHRLCDDIGTVKIPHWIKSHTGKEVLFHFCSGGDFPDDITPYKLIIHCGSCMLNEREVLYRKTFAKEQNIPFTNYGTAIAHLQGILKRSIAMFDELTGV